VPSLVQTEKLVWIKFSRVNSKGYW